MLIRIYDEIADIGANGTWTPGVDDPLAWPIPPGPDLISLVAPAPAAPAAPRAGGRGNAVAADAALPAANALQAISGIYNFIQAETQYRFPILIRLVQVEPAFFPPAAKVGAEYPWDTQLVAGGALVPAIEPGLLFFTIIINDFSWDNLRLAIGSVITCRTGVRDIEGQIGPYNPATRLCPSMRICTELDIPIWIASAKSALLPTPIRLRIIHNRGAGAGDSPPVGYARNPAINFAVGRAGAAVGAPIRSRNLS